MCVLPLRALALAILSHYPTILVLEYGAHGKGHYTASLSSYLPILVL